MQVRNRIASFRQETDAHILRWFSMAITYKEELINVPLSVSRFQKKWLLGTRKIS